jgi:hypothetical protein
MSVTSGSDSLSTRPVTFTVAMSCTPHVEEYMCASNEPLRAKSMGKQSPGKRNKILYSRGDCQYKISPKVKRDTGNIMSTRGRLQRQGNGCSTLRRHARPQARALRMNTQAVTGSNIPRRGTAETLGVPDSRGERLGPRPLVHGQLAGLARPAPVRRRMAERARAVGAVRSHTHHLRHLGHNGATRA